MSYVDLHLHLLPGVDDGPRTLALSLAHAERMVSAGVREATVTPHVGHPRFRVDPETIPGRAAVLQDALDAAGIALRVHPGGELHAGAATSFDADQLDLIAHGPPHARWVLLEAPFSGLDARFADACQHLRDTGFGLVVAHPERAQGFAEHGRRWLAAELAAGALLQVNVCSLLGAHGPAAQASATALVRGGQAHLLASDGHGGARAQTLAEGLRPAIAAGATPGRAARLLGENPLRLLRDGITPGGRRDAGATSAVAAG